MSATKFEGSARDRLLAAANELFYQEGVHTVGIDRVIEHAGVAKASLYSTFGSKEELVGAYLQGRADLRQERISKRIALYDTPRARILGVFELLAELVAQPTFRGCAFVNASAEGPRGEGKVNQVCASARSWTRELLTGLARELGVADPEQLGRQLAILYDGTSVTAAMDKDPSVAHEARAMAELLIDARMPDKPRKSRSARASKARPTARARS